MTDQPATTALPDEDHGEVEPAHLTARHLFARGLDGWQRAIDQHRSEEVAGYFTGNALFQGAHPGLHGRPGRCGQCPAL